MASQPNAEWTEDQQNRNTELDSFIKTSPPFVKEHALQIRNFLRHAKHHKIARVALAIMDRVAENEKVVVFCHHHATMLELSEALYALEKNTAIKKTNAIAPELWRETWVALLTKKLPDDPDLLACASTFVCADSFRTQASSWLDESRDFTERADLTKALSETRVRRYARAIVGVPTILQAVLSILKWESHDVGNDREARVKTSVPSALRQHEWPSTVTSVGDDLNATLALFNTPFGPDVLVATDKLSEGIDLHGCCRILVHYELDPSPVRVRQREGRIRRIGSWAGKTGSAVEYAYPAYMGTRDETLVRIVKKRLAQFDLLLGGAPDVDDHDSRTKENAMFNSLEELKKLVEADIRGCLISPLGI